MPRLDVGPQVPALKPERLGLIPTTFDCVFPGTSHARFSHDPGTKAIQSSQPCLVDLGSSVLEPECGGAHYRYRRKAARLLPTPTVGHSIERDACIAQLVFPRAGGIHRA